MDRYGTGGQNRYVNTLADEDGPAQPLQQEAADRPTFVDENNNERSLFGSLSQHAIVRLRVGAQVLCTSKVHDKVRTGSIGTVLRFEDPTESVEGHDEYEYGWKVDKVQGAHDRDCVQLEQLWHVVKLIGEDGTAVMTTIKSKQVNVEDNLGQLLCSRTQLPLILAYALKVH